MRPKKDAIKRINGLGSSLARRRFCLKSRENEKRYTCLRILVKGKTKTRKSTKKDAI